jgi:hypothetical protein
MGTIRKLRVENGNRRKKIKGVRFSGHPLLPNEGKLLGFVFLPFL